MSKTNFKINKNMRIQKFAPPTKANASRNNFVIESFEEEWPN